MLSVGWTVRQTLDRIVKKPESTKRQCLSISGFRPEQASSLDVPKAFDKEWFGRIADKLTILTVVSGTVLQAGLEKRQSK